MRDARLRALALIAAVMTPAAPAWAQTASAVAPTDQPAGLYEPALDGLVALMRGERGAEAVFHPGFLAIIPEAQLRLAFAQLTAALGPVEGFEELRPTSRTATAARLRFQRGSVPIRVEVAPDAPHRITTFWYGAPVPAGDNAATLARDFAALPGRAAWWSGAVGPDGRLAEGTGHLSDAQLAVGSVFKLWVLDALAAEVAAGRLGWDQVVRERAASFSSPATARWPAGAPVTVHTLATWMIALSDNGATDTLVRLVGQDAIARSVAASGHARPIGMTPMPTTVEAFALKADANADLRARWIAGDVAARTALLRAAVGRLTLAAATADVPDGRPRHVDSVEWFASPRDVAGILARFTRPDRAVARDILAVDPGLSVAARGDWRWIGYKGGSETGVIAIAYLAQRADGRWQVVTGAWNDPTTAVDDQAFARLMERAVGLAARE